VDCIVPAKALCRILLIKLAHRGIVGSKNLIDCMDQDPSLVEQGVHLVVLMPGVLFGGNASVSPSLCWGLDHYCQHWIILQVGVPGSGHLVVVQHWPFCRRFLRDDRNMGRAPSTPWAGPTGTQPICGVLRRCPAFVPQNLTAWYLVKAVRNVRNVNFVHCSFC
jgi:hypothetical protein